MLKNAVDDKKHDCKRFLRSFVIGDVMMLVGELWTAITFMYEQSWGKSVPFSGAQ